MLKQITSSLIYPKEGLGKQFWNRIYQRAWSEYHTTNIPVNTFNKVWIVPDEAMVYESGNTAYILRSHLKVMLEEDYLSLSKHTAITTTHRPTQSKEVNKIGSQVVREIVLPELEKEVNTGKNFANLRQMYSGMVLATWYKKELKESLLGKVYADKVKVKGVDQDPQTNEAIYQQYLKAFKKGVFNYIKEDVDKYTNETIPRKYFSGGFTRDRAMIAPDGSTRLTLHFTIVHPKDLEAMPSEKRESFLKGLKLAWLAPEIVTVQFDPTTGSYNVVQNTSGEAGGQTLFANNLPEQEITAGQSVVTALWQSMVIKSQGNGSWVTVNVTPRLRTAVEDLLTVVNHQTVRLPEGNLNARQIADVQARLSRILGSSVTVARGGKSLSFKSTLSAFDMKQMFDAAMKSSEVTTALVSGFLLTIFSLSLGIVTLNKMASGQDFFLSYLDSLYASAASLLIGGSLLAIGISKRWGTNTEFIRHNVRVVPMTNGKEGSIITLLRPKENPINNKEWSTMMDSLIKALGVTASNEYAVTKGNSELAITTSVPKADLDKKILDMAMAGTNQTLSKKDKASISQSNPFGGIDLNSANLNLQIKRDGKGVPLPLAQQDMAQLNTIEGFIPKILEIRPAVDFPIISELQQKLQATSVS